VDQSIIAIVFFAGVLPALFWVWFWLKEDARKPEPFQLIALAFLGGMLMVPAAYHLQKLLHGLYTENTEMLVWVVVEEVLKYAAALLLVLWRKAVNEPIDLFIYMVVVALGFSALENTLFLIDPLMNGAYMESIITGKFRFLGATLVHVLSSGIIGVTLAFAYYKSRQQKILFSLLGLSSAIALHATFNFLIIGSTGEGILNILFLVWIGIVALLFTLEKVKHSHPPITNRSLKR
jgi:Predicted membrane protein